jgi:transcriptional regulator with XRE-family HTH domain
MFTTVKMAYDAVKMREELGRQLHQARSTRGLSLEAASRAAKISQGYLHKLEAGRVNNPSPRVLQRLGTALGISYHRLMDLAGYLLPDQPPPGRAGTPSTEDGDQMTTTETEPAPTNQELVRLLQAVLGELAELRAGQEALARAVEQLTARRKP